MRLALITQIIILSSFSIHADEWITSFHSTYKDGVFTFEPMPYQYAGVKITPIDCSSHTEYDTFFTNPERREFIKVKLGQRFSVKYQNYIFSDIFILKKFDDTYAHFTISRRYPAILPFTSDRIIEIPYKMELNSGYLLW